MVISGNIHNEIVSRVLVLDGAMGTMVQRYGLEESEFRGERFRDFPVNLKGNNDLLVLTRPDVIREIHEAYLLAGADIIETDTFNANSISLADYHLEDLAYEINLTAARLAREAADHFSAIPDGKPRWVAGSMGPTGKTASLAPDVHNPAMRSITFDELYSAYREQARGLLDGGADLLIVETIFDTLNAKAALIAVFDEIEGRPADVTFPVIACATISDASGRTLSGQTLESFLVSLQHFDLFAIGLNCSLGAAEIRPYLEELSSKAPFPVIVYPNAGLPNQFGEYDQSPAEMAGFISDFLNNGYANIIGGCCGTTPEHIRAFSALAESAPPRKVPERTHLLRLSGLEPLTVFEGSNFINIGERTNVSGSKKFARLIREEKYEEALSIARQQVENGAQVIDINMDEAMLDAGKAMVSFLNMAASDPDVARVPFMIDSSDFSVISAALKCIQGKPVVNSISLKDGEAAFIEHARTLHRFGAATVVMAFDEEGQATTFGRRIAVVRRAYEILTKKVGFPPEDIIFDPNVLTIATGMEEHNNFAVDFLKTTGWIKTNLPYAGVSGGISNLSFAFRGNDALREAMHSVFLFHAVKAGLDMGIVNAGALPVYDEIPKVLLRLVEDVILNRRKNATERLLAYAGQMAGSGKRPEQEAEWRSLPVAERIRLALVKGNADYIGRDIDEIIPQYRSALKIIEGPLMDGMDQVGTLFGSGKMFLPQVVRSARVMKQAVAKLTPLLEDEKKAGSVSSGKKGKVLLATVKGDVHDIGKNIVGVVLSCNNYEITDLGVMVPSDQIIAAIQEHNPDIIGLSGLITPSLNEMIHVAKEMERHHYRLPLMIGGATTSEIHTAVKIAPVYSGPVIHVKDASRAAGVAGSLLSQGSDTAFTDTIRDKYSGIRDSFYKKEDNSYIPLQDARKNRIRIDWQNYKPVKPRLTGTKVFVEYPLEEIRQFIDWNFFFRSWRMTGKYPAILSDPVSGTEASRLFSDAQRLLKEITGKKMLIARGVIGIYPCNSTGDDVELYTDDSRSRTLTTFHFLRNQQLKDPDTPNLCLADFIAPKDLDYPDYIGGFAVTAGLGVEEWAGLFEKELDEYSAIMMKILADRLAEAFAELIHLRVRREYWGYAREEHLDLPALIREEYQGIRPAPGYPACPDHSEKQILFDLLDADRETGIHLTENFAMYPGASVSGLYFAHPLSRYFNLGRIGKDQMADYAKRKNLSFEHTEKMLGTILNY